MTEVRPRLRLEYRTPAELTENPANWRTHPEEQVEALGATIERVGWAGACLFNERTGRLIDGHARRGLGIERGEEVPVLIGSWSEEEEAMILASFDPITALAGVNTERLQSLLNTVNRDNEAVNLLFDRLALENGIALPEAWGGTPPAPEPGAYDPTAETFVIKITDVKSTDKEIILEAVRAAIAAAGMSYEAAAY